MFMYYVSVTLYLLKLGMNNFFFCSQQNYMSTYLNVLLKYITGYGDFPLDILVGLTLDGICRNIHFADFA